MRKEFGSGNWIDIAPVQGLKAKHRDAYEGAPKIYIKFREDGSVDMSDMPLSMTLAKLQRNGLLATLITDWSFESTSDDGIPTGTKLPVPHWNGTEIEGNESFGEIPIDDMDELEDLLQPYLKKVQRKPDPKKTITGGSTGPSRDTVPSPTGSAQAALGTSTSCLTTGLPPAGREAGQTFRSRWRPGSCRWRCALTS